MKKVVSMILCFMFIMVACAIPVMAITPVTNTAKIITPDWVNLSYGESTIDQLGSGYVGAEGYTCAGLPADEVGVTIYLQQFKNGTWNTIKTQSYKAYNVGSIDRSFSYFVTPNYNYKTISYHWVRKGVTTESVWSDSGSIWVD